MKHIRNITAKAVMLLLVSLTFTACTTQQQTQEAIMAVNQQLESRWAKGDAAGVAALYTEDAQILMSNLEFVTGQAAIQETFQGFIGMGLKRITLETLEVEDYGNAASEVGKYTLKSEAGQVLDHGKFIVIWKKDAGQWKLHRDIFNTSMPAIK